MLLIQSTDNRYLRFIDYKNLILWDVKRYYNNHLTSTFDWVSLIDCINEENHKVRPMDFPNDDFSILGVNNIDGIFDSYIKKGADLNQPYKVLEDGWLAYNPYRINVGSIGLKTKKQKHKYISPAYIVFSCHNTVLPEYLLQLFRTNLFNTVIRESTTGSVRQNLTFDALTSIQIPLPSIEVQTKIIHRYNQGVSESDQYLEIVKKKESTIKNKLNAEFGITSNEVIRTSKFNFIEFKNLVKWGVDSQPYNNMWSINPSFDQFKIIELCEVGSGGTPDRSIKSYFIGDIPWVKTGEVLNEIISDTEEKISLEAINNSNAKIYPKGSLIIAMYGQGSTRGRTAKLEIEAATNQACAVLYNFNKNLIDPDFLWLYMTNEYERLRDLASGNNQPNLNIGMISQYEIQVPKLEYQKEIINWYFEQKREIRILLEISEGHKSEAIKDFESSIFSNL